MSDEPKLSISEAIEQTEALIAQEEAALAAKRAKLAEFKRLAAELNIPIPISYPWRAAVPSPAEPVPAPSSPLANAKEAKFDGTMVDLVRHYKTDERSPFHKLRFKTRENYAFNLDRLARELPGAKLADLAKADLQRLYDGWAADGKLHMGHGMMGKLRMLFTFGADALEDVECQRLFGVLQSMHFELPKGRAESLTAEHANAVRAAAHEKDWDSIAFAQAIQFGSELRQRDVIGEWVPVGEPGPPSDIFDGKGHKWLRGVRWNQVDENLVLHHTTSFLGKKVEMDLKLQPMIVQELESKYGALVRSRMPASGAIIICEQTNLPWSAAEFRRKWRVLANAAGVPPHVKNMDSIRAGSNDDSAQAADA